MRTRAPRDPLAPDALERFTDRYGLARALVAGTALTATLVIAFMAAIFVVTGLWMTAEAIAPQVPRAILGLGAPDLTLTDRVAPAVAQVAPTAQARPGRVDTPAGDPAAPASATSTTTAAPASSAAAILAVVAGTTPVTSPALSWPSPLAPPAPTTGTPTTTPTAAPAAVGPTTTPTSTPDATTTTTPNTATSTTTGDPAPTTSATTTTPAPSPSASDGGDHRKGHGRCTPRKHKKGRC